MKRQLLSVGVGIALLSLIAGPPLALGQEPYLVKDINPGLGNAFVDDVSALGNLIIFEAEDDVNGAHPWVSDGTAEGTMLLKVIHTGSGSLDLGDTAILDGFLYFSADDGTNGSEVWRTDGTPEGTSLFHDINDEPGDGSSPQRFEESGGKLFFRADDGEGAGRELWVSLGVPGDSVMVEDINPSGDGEPEGLEDVGGLLFFSATDSTGDIELYRSDGTAPGTFRIADINATGSSEPFSIEDVGGVAFFSANDGVDGEELWMSDGTLDNATLIRNINTHGSDGSDVGNIRGVGSFAYFTATDGDSGKELWRSDGTFAGTVQVHDINTGSSGSDLSGLTIVDGNAFFWADDGSDIELWVSGGTPGGGDTMKLEINSTGDGNPGEPERAGSLLYFTADDGVIGSELYRTDGTVEGTHLIRDLNPGSDGGSISNTQYAGGRLFFSADEGNGLGEELYAIAVDLPHLANISTRGQVGTGDNVMIAGIIIEGGRKRVLVRVLGPTLDGFGVPNTLDDPFLQIFSGATEIASNDDWQDTQQTEIEATGFAPGDLAEPGIILELDPGNYTAIVSGVGGTTGNAIVEVFELD